MSGIFVSSFSLGRKAGCPDVSSGRQPPSLLPFQAVRPPVFRISPAEEFLFSHTWSCGRHLSYSPFSAVRVPLFLFWHLLAPEPVLFCQFTLYFQDPDVFLCLLFNTATGRSIEDTAFPFFLYFPASSFFFSGLSAGKFSFLNFPEVRL